MKQELTLWFKIFSELFMRILELEKTTSCKICTSDTALAMQVSQFTLEFTYMKTNFIRIDTILTRFLILTINLH